MFNIGCEERPKVGVILNNNEGVSNHITLTQGLKMERFTSTYNANPSTTAKVTNLTQSSLQTMSQTNEPGWMEVEDSMISPSAKAARESRRIALEEARRAAVVNLGTPNSVRE